MFLKCCTKVTLVSHEMKSLARGIVWWPKLDADQETLVRSCKACQENQKCCSKVQLHPWEWPAEPWARVHVDFFGPFLGKQFFIIVDAHSKWIDVCVVSSPSSQQAIQALRRVFSTHGLPQILVSDNGAAFSSSEFQNICYTKWIQACQKCTLSSGHQRAS